MSRRLSTFADVTLLVGSGLCLIVLSYFVYHYAWTGSRVFTGVLAPYLYYGIPTAVGALLLASFRLPPIARVRLSAVLGSTVIAVYAFAILATLWDQLPSVRERRDIRHARSVAAALGLEFDGRTKAEVVNDLRARGMDAVPAIFVTGLLQSQRDGTLKSSINIDGVDVMPLSGISDKLTVLCNESGKYVTYRSDEHGFNNPRNLWGAPVDILAVGDSFVQGTCVDPAENVVARIRRRYPATVNAGIGGDGPLIMLAALKEYGRFAKPKVLLWFYFEGNDLQELVRESRSPILRQYLTSTFTQNLFSRQAAIDRALISTVERSQRAGAISAVIENVSYAASTVFDRSTPIQDIVKLDDLRSKFGLVGGRTPEAQGALAGAEADQFDLFRRVVVEARTTVAAWGGRLYCVYLPEWNRFGRPESVSDRNRWAVQRAFQDSGVPLVDVTQAFSAQRDVLSLFSLRIGYHYNEEGARVVADAVLPAITFVN